MAIYSSGNSDGAKELFQETSDAGFPLADYSLYYLAMIAVKESNWDQARQLFSQLRLRYPRSVWINPATLQVAKLDIAERKFSQASEALRRLRANRSAKREIADEAHYLQAQTQEALGSPGAAHALYLELRDASPNSRWTALARRDQARLREEHPDLFAFHTPQSLAEEADRLVRERQSNEAEILFKKLLNNASEPQSRLRYLSKLSGLYLSTRNRNAAMPVLERIAGEYPQSAEAAQALYQIGQILWNRHDNAQALEYFKRVTDQYPTSAFVDRAQFASADIHEFFGRKDRAIQLYRGVGKQFPSSPMRDDAGWRLAWLHYRTGNLSRAESAFRELGAQSKNGAFALPSLYWRARIAERTDDLATAEKLYRQIANA
ncbi:MAG TPA: tetratricopeptide repeat protein, partial [Candidatus Limnocylindria bacterium]|nr:tetratricopeptide repeat protein [Candidatus Limnocylindria bacterium]